MFEYSKENRLLKNREFQTVYSSSSKWVSELFVALGRMSECQIPKLGVVVSKKVGPSVVRNRIKRLCKEVFRYNKAQYSNLNVVLIARKGVDTSCNATITKDIGWCLLMLYKKLLKTTSSVEVGFEK